MAAQQFVRSTKRCPAFLRNAHKSWAPFFVFLSIAFDLSTQSSAQITYYATEGGGFGTINASGQVTTILPGGLSGSLFPVADVEQGSIPQLLVAPNGTLYAFNQGYGFGAVNVWGTVDPATGAFTQIGNLDTAFPSLAVAFQNLPALAFDANGNLLAGGNGNAFGTLNLTTGAFQQTIPGPANFIVVDQGAQNPGQVMATAPSILVANGGPTIIGGASAAFGHMAQGGTFSSTYYTETSQSALQTALGAAASGIHFGLVGQNADGSISPGSAVQYWDLHYTGTFTGEATVTLHYDPTLTGGVPTSDFQIWHYTNGGWNPVANEVVNPINDTITFTTDSFSPFILGVPEPSTFVLAAIGLVSLGFATLRKKYRRA